MTMRLVPYAGTPLPRPKPVLSLSKGRVSDKDRRAALLANIHARQKQARLLSEIGAEFGSHIMVRAVLLAWLFEAAA
jgi:hypothetical protein